MSGAQRPGARGAVSLGLAAAIALASGCARDDQERRGIFEDAQRTNNEIVAGTVVRDLRAPSDTGRLVYDSAVSLRQAPAAAAGTRQVWSPFGIAQPDTVPPTARQP